ncbi:hypothetical protein PGT21_015898 [Puccinia graminis f. sp. tritici]|uniref:Uncharacterized protein n=1 Tax=Puccinia graminis f. sp. tritici TaxID=56615 RepID=A0A5B0QIJ5_PUCGR|nr:hypothetical protein PGT21_015898 [Puccinia graminis f. sp. tritici]
MTNLITDFHIGGHLIKPSIPHASSTTPPGVVDGIWTPNRMYQMPSGLGPARSIHRMRFAFC